MSVKNYILLMCGMMVLLAFGSIWVITNIFSILKVVLPAAVLAALVAGILIGRMGNPRKGPDETKGAR